jgi:transcription antitermination factor NusG
MGSNEWVAARSAPGVAYFLLTPDAPVPLPDDLISAIRARAEAHARKRRQPTFRPGDRVMIRSGPFDGLEATFSGRLSGSERVRVLLAVVNRLAPVELDIAYLRPAG